jgi:CRISPR-associated protein Cas5 subtype I-B
MKYMHTNPDWWQNIPLYFQNKTSSKNIQFAVPASVEFLVEPKYRIYIDCEVIASELATMLKKKRTHYTPYLGSSSMICSTKYVGEFDYDKISSLRKDYLPVCSIIPFSDRIPRIKIKKELRFAIEEGLPVHIDNQRSHHGTYKVVYTPEPGNIQVIDNDIIELHFGGTTSYVKFLPTQITS